ncbi:DUF4199 domain-containing protein [Pseudoflavitalea sp. X16]|uniref:DUF4199 domain-containing protein n=1 Tax=Paraflavitalea devenefica TaxID=2716334 RepID=UPI00141FE10D|nr:DUF4199 domain-containing protein [Paraflavitalea devenefica]NII28912.1 DUF4199 domain-containing protein [Paraflavitalea devenefica]
METTSRKSATGPLFGLIAGVVMCGFIFILYKGGLQLYMSNTARAGYVAIIAIAVIAGLREKKRNGGYLSLSEGLKVIFMVFALGSLLQTVFTHILLSYVDVPFGEASKQLSIERYVAFMKSTGASESQVEDYIKNANDPKNDTFMATLLSYCIFCIGYFVVSLIIAAIIRKKRPPFENSFNQ